MPPTIGCTGLYKAKEAVWQADGKPEEIVFFLEVARLLILFLRMERKRLTFTTNGRPPGIIDSVAVWFAGRY